MSRKHNRPLPEDRLFKRVGLPDTTKVLDASQGIVEAIVNVYGVIDSYNDIVHPGAARKTIFENGNRIKILDSHNMWSTGDVIGVPLSVREVGRDELPPSVLERFPEATGGLYCEMQFRLNTELGRNAFELIQLGQLEYSIGFDIIQSDVSNVYQDEKGFFVPCLDARPDLLKNSAGVDVQIRNLREIKLYDISPVVFGANEATATVSVRSAGKTQPDAPDGDDSDSVSIDIVIPDEESDQIDLTLDDDLDSPVLQDYDTIDETISTVINSLTVLQQKLRTGRANPAESPTPTDGAGPVGDTAPAKQALIDQINDFLADDS